MQAVSPAAENNEKSGLYPWASRNLAPEELDEAQARPLAAVVDLELVRERADDGEAEPAFAQFAPLMLPPFEVEARSGVRDLDHKSIGVQLVVDLDDALAPVPVGVTNGIGACLRHRQLEVGESLLRKVPEAPEPRQGQADKRDVLGLRRDREVDGVCCGRRWNGNSLDCRFTLPARRAQKTRFSDLESAVVAARRAGRVCSADCCRG